MKLNNEEIKHIAQLSRLELSTAEESKYEKDLSMILDYVETLNEADTRDVLPTAFVGDLKNVWRLDDSKSWAEDEIKLALEQGEMENNFVKVKRVL